jgi:hypothetical protein
MAKPDRLALDHEPDPGALSSIASRLVLTRQRRPLGGIRRRVEPPEDRARLAQRVLETLPRPSERGGLFPPDLLFDPAQRVRPATQAGGSGRVIRS